MTKSVEEIEGLGLEAQVSEFACEGCVFNREGGKYGGVKCTDVPCTPYSMDGLDVVWVKRAGPQ